MSLVEVGIEPVYSDILWKFFLLHLHSAKNAKK